jgi:hypothetical protein
VTAQAQLTQKWTKIGGLAWHPAATLTAGPDVLNFASGGGEGTVKPTGVRLGMSHSLTAPVHEAVKMYCELGENRMVDKSSM